MFPCRISTRAATLHRPLYHLPSDHSPLPHAGPSPCYYRSNGMREDSVWTNRGGCGTAGAGPTGECERLDGGCVCMFAASMMCDVLAWGVLSTFICYGCWHTVLLTVCCFRECGRAGSNCHNN